LLVRYTVWHFSAPAGWNQVSAPLRSTADGPAACGCSGSETGIVVALIIMHRIRSVRLFIHVY
jgi:hypothetical protein